MSCGPPGRDDNCMLHLISDEFLQHSPQEAKRRKQVWNSIIFPVERKSIDSMRPGVRFPRNIVRNLKVEARSK